MKTRKCPSCRGPIKIFRESEPGDEVFCEDCEREFSILSIDPIQLEPIELYDDYYFEEGEY